MKAIASRVVVIILCYTIITDSSEESKFTGAKDWCLKFRGSKSKPISEAFDLDHLVEHLNEDLHTTATLEAVRASLGPSEGKPANQTEQSFLHYCENVYSKVLEISPASKEKKGFSIFHIRPTVWAASLIAIVVISAVGLLGVGVVPLVQKMFFNQVIQYLVAVAVGTLTGDAFLHLLPHAIMVNEGHSHEAAENEDAANAERMAVYKGLVALGGVYFFFMAEKILGFVSEYRAEKKLEKEDREKAMQNPRRSLDVRRLSAFRPSLVSGTLNVPGQVRRISQLDPTPCRRASRAMSLANEDILTTGLSSKAMRSIDILYRYAEEDAQLENQALSENEDECTHLTAKAVQEKQNLVEFTTEPSSVKLTVPKVVLLPDEDDEESHSHEKDRKESVHSDHGENQTKKHGHGHSHEVPGSVASVAWMVILGDGLHNFTDGMAIGAAFAQSVSGGLSTAVAVFCHELPHELGDFAVLLKTGMRIKEALFFNIVSSVLSLIGMLVGIALGNVESASYWIFAITAGTFIYIALVDMLPELSSAELRPGQTRIGQVFLQSLGLFTGVGIMLSIALFEDRIKVVMD